MTREMKTAPSPKARGHSGKSTKQRDATQRVRTNPRKQAKELVEALYGEPVESEELTENDDPESSGPEKYREPAQRPLPTTVPGCFRLMATFGNARRTELTQLGLDTLRDQAGLGRAMATIAYVLGVSKSMLQSLITDHEQVRNAYELGKALYEDRITDALTRMADHQNVAAAIWLEKTRYGRRDNAPVGDGTRHVHIHLPDSVSREDYMRSLALVHADSHKQAIEASREAESGNSLPAAPPTWLTEGATTEGQPTNEELQAHIQEALATPEQRATEKLKEAAAQPAPAGKSHTAKALDVDR